MTPLTATLRLAPGHGVRAEAGHAGDTAPNNSSRALPPPTFFQHGPAPVLIYVAYLPSANRLQAC